MFGVGLDQPLVVNLALKLVGLVLLTLGGSNKLFDH